MFSLQRFHFSFIFCLLCIVLNACAKKEVAPKLDLKMQIKTQQPSIPFATTQAESDKWYKEHLSPIVKKSKKEQKQEFEQFAKLYFADLSQMSFESKEVPQDALLQSVSFTHFTQDFFKEIVFIQNLGFILAPWEALKTKISLHGGAVSAGFVVQIARTISQFENESYKNLNDVVLASNLLVLTKKYTKAQTTNKTTQKITGLASYILPDMLYSYLFYRIVYAQYEEKFGSNYLLSLLSLQYPDSMLQASNKILHTKFKRNEIKTMQKHFRFAPFEPTNPLSIMQCRAGDTRYKEQKECIQKTFIAWISYLQNLLKPHDAKYVLPVFSDSKLCLLVSRDGIIAYPHNEGSFCKNLITSWQSYESMQKKRKK